MSGITLSKWQDHLRVNGRAPTTLEEVAVARAEGELRRKLAEIKAMRAKLALLAEFDADLVKAGIHLSEREFSTYDGGKTLRVFPLILTRDEKLCSALVALGFKEIARKSSGTRDEEVTLKHGRSLVLKLDVRKAEEPAS